MNQAVFQDGLPPASRLYCHVPLFHAKRMYSTEQEKNMRAELKILALILVPALLASSACAIKQPEPPPAPVTREQAVSPQKSGKSYTVRGHRYELLSTSDGFVEEGKAHWYGGKRFHGRRTANGEKYNQHAMTAAHKILPFQTWVEVTNLKNRKSVRVRINDRGPFTPGCVIDLSRAAASSIGLLSEGAVEVRALPAP
jgi:rare lipoprotein A